MRELLARMRVGSPNNKIQIKTPRTNMEISSNYTECVFCRNSPCKCENFNLPNRNRFGGLLKIVEITETGRPFGGGK